MSTLRVYVVTALLIYTVGLAPDVARSQVSPATNSVSPRSLESLRGNWLGIARFSDGSELRMGLEIMRKADGSTGANVSMVDRGVAYIAVSGLGLQKDELALRLDGPGLTIEGRLSAHGGWTVPCGDLRRR